MDDPFDVLRRRFVARCQGELASLERIAREGAAALDDSRRDQLVKTVHSLAGAGGMFGFSGLSERASMVETLLGGDSEATPAQIKAALDELVLELQRITG
ncbi:Hpt domain-containing protein [Arvimicrobium flavum]|uniref:Hpt domain-containing protein n=1 Tax=Arvimicrobium flavum TaxID=3393320 RepID=UPI00237C3D8D|nr:Hpt domain-containing protein [Mesorhizobium shangrilense]